MTKQFKLGFINLVHHIDWVAKIVPTLKNDWKLITCVDSFGDLNKAFPNYKG